ncbi:MAG: STAS domain-containing protein [Chlamydiia bacterium]|nr:STAS domain-containing protein [Chlamydiia bacterium]
MSNGIKFELEEKGHVSLFRLEGRLDATSSPQLEIKLQEKVDAGQKNILLDFGRVDYLSSAGMRLLLSMTRRLKGDGGQLAVCSLNDDVMEIIKVAGFERILNIHPTETTALDSF